MNRRSTFQQYTTYIACDALGNVYGGSTCKPKDRKSEHKRNGKFVLAFFSHENVEAMQKAEKWLIHFLISQSQEESFECTNKLLRS
jgi:hypothetical protein